MTAGPSQQAPAPPARPLTLLTRPWFWLLFVGLLFSVPLIKGLGAGYPQPLPGVERARTDFELPDEQGQPVRLADLAGHLVVLTELPLANAVQSGQSMAALQALRKRLRGLGSAVVFVSLAHGADAAALSALLDEWTARKPVNVFLLDDGRAVLERLREEAGSASADFLLYDTHGRLRGVYGLAASDRPMSAQGEAARQALDEANQTEIDRLVQEAGQLANWAASDP